MSCQMGISDVPGWSWIPEKMEMYADLDVRAGVLEPEAVVEIKLRRDKIPKPTGRLDPVFASLKESVCQSKTAEESAAAVEKLTPRENT